MESMGFEFHACVTENGTRARMAATLFRKLHGRTFRSVCFHERESRANHHDQVLAKRWLAGSSHPMNAGQAIQTAGRIGGFCARHFLALLVTVVVPCVIWTIVYFALLLWAVFTNGGIGGPLAYPAGLLFFFLAASVASLLLFLPSTALAEWFAKRHAFPILAQIPISVAILALLCLMLVSIAAAVGAPPSVRGFSLGFGVLFVSQLLPLGLYWWSAQSGPLLVSLAKRLLRRFRP